MEPEDFREPLMMDEFGLYITVAQMDFFLNRKNGPELMDSASPEFMDYYQNCLLYNMVYDMMEAEPETGDMYWDENTQSVAFSFPVNGKISKALASISSSIFEENYDDFDEDEFNLFS